LPTLTAEGLAWTVNQGFVPGVWFPNATFTSTNGFYNSTVFSQAFKAATNITPDTLSAAAFVAGIVYTDALQRAGTIDPVILSAAIAQTNLSLFYGPVSFDPVGHLLQDATCVQFLNGSEVVVYPDSVKAANAIYPSSVRSPPAFYDLPLPPGPDYTLRNALIITGCILLFLVLVGGLLFIALRNRYHMIFIPKEEITEEWAQ